VWHGISYKTHDMSGYGRKSDFADVEYFCFQVLSWPDENQVIGVMGWMKCPALMRTRIVIEGGIICSREGWDGWLESQAESRILESAENLCHQNLGRHEGRGNEDAAGGSGDWACGIR
jgi:hypothetical protein